MSERTEEVVKTLREKYRQGLEQEKLEKEKRQVARKEKIKRLTGLGLGTFGLLLLLSGEEKAVLPTSPRPQIPNPPRAPLSLEEEMPEEERIVFPQAASPFEETVQIPKTESQRPFLMGGIDFRSTLSLWYPSFSNPEEGWEFVLTAEPDDDVFKREFGGKSFVYQDKTGAMILAMHANYYETNPGQYQPLEAEFLRQEIEGSDLFTLPILTRNEVEERLKELRGQEIIFTQNDKTAVFEIADGVRLNPQKTREFAEKPTELGTLFGEIEDPQDSIILLFCSKPLLEEQPFEENRFPARYVLLLTLRQE